MKLLIPLLPAVIVDTREQRPYTFDRLTTHDGKPVSSSKGTLRSGDYSLSDRTECVAVERKSLADLYSTLSHGRKRFAREMDRLSAMRFAAIVIEASLHEIVTAPPTRMSPKSVIATILAWSIRYPVRWLPCDNRRLAETITLRVLERYWIESFKELQIEKDRPNDRSDDPDRADDEPGTLDGFAEPLPPGAR